MLDQAKKYAKENHLEGKAAYILGDFVEEWDKVSDVDITFLDKVVCCYEDYVALLERSTAENATQSMPSAIRKIIC